MQTKVKFELTNNYTYIAGEVPQEVHNLCTIPYDYWTQDFYTKQKVMKTRQLKYLYFISKFSISYFPTGWFNKIYQLYIDLDYEVEIIDNTTSHDTSSLALSLITPPLRNYQLDIVTNAIKAKRGILVAPPGSGKTLIYTYLLSYYGLKSLIIVPSINLLNQVYLDLDKALPGLIGKIGDSEWSPNLITVATIQTLWSRLNQEDSQEFFNSILVLMIEEGHHVKNAGYNPRNTYFQIVMTINAPYRFGITATPGKEGSLERELLEAATGSLIGGIGASTLVEQGYLIRPKIKMHIIPIHNIGYDWYSAYERNIVGNTYRNALICKLAKEFAAEGKSVLISCNWVEKHGKILCNLLGEGTSMFGETSSNDRKNILESFESKDCKIIVSTIMNEGVNIPSMDVIILASAGKSQKQMVQRIGRVMRPSKGKDTAIVIDFYDRDRGILEKHSKQRLNLYQSEEAYDIELIQSPKEEANFAEFKFI